MSDTSTVRIESRFHGPAGSGNGGYTCGLLAERVGGPAEVTLRSPPPLDVPLALTRAADGTCELRQSGVTIAHARPLPGVQLDLPQPVTFAEATSATAGYPGFRHHPYPTCFVCGPRRPAGDGLGLFPGPVGSRKIVAAPFRPAAELCDEQGLLCERFVWAALDCPSWFGHAAFNEPGPPILLGRLSAELRARPQANDPCVVVGFGLAREGRRILCGSALLGASGDYLAWAHATWIELKT